MWIAVWVVVALLSAPIGYHAARAAGRGNVGVLLGLALGPIGVGLALLLPRTAWREALHQVEVERCAESLRKMFAGEREAHVEAQENPPPGPPVKFRWEK